MLKFRRVVFKHVVLKDYRPELVKLDLDQFFWCETYQQYICGHACVQRYHTHETFGFQGCHKCPIRKATWRALRVPRIIYRKPRVESNDND